MTSRIMSEPPQLIVRVVCPVCKKKVLEEIMKGSAACRKCRELLVNGKGKKELVSVHKQAWRW